MTQGPFRIQGPAGRVGVLRDIGHGDTKSNRNDTARTSSVAVAGRRLTDTAFLHKLNRTERRWTTLTQMTQMTGRDEGGEGRKGKTSQFSITI